MSEEEIYQKARGELIDELDQIGREAKAFVRRNTPIDTGFARRSVYYVVLDEFGNVIKGDRYDENGESTPHQFPGAANGTLRVIVGANAPYYIWIEIGARGRPGHQALAQASDQINAKIRRYYATQPVLVR